ncbi:Transducin (beta)-like 1 X-linked receptor 1 [Linnemannia exigua]|uniref:Transducin (Beta)-like 1 X-linked receptor 1 n=1 Tax=Linnemannia exigua TaxID=604196 RepID=A0AAD4D457_9FUNG|nr:Transducin (beta)-like 1 X-linked receptor 1 [Linnemannia exigua]
MSASPGKLPTQAISSVISLFVSTNAHRIEHSSAANVSCQAPEDEKEPDQGCSGDPGLFSGFPRKAYMPTKLKSKKSAFVVPPRSSMNSVKTTVNLVTIDSDGSPISPVIQTPEHHQSTNDHHALPRGGLNPSRANGKPLPPLPIAMQIREGIFSADAPTTTRRSTTPANHHARFESTHQFAFCVSLLREDPLISTSEGSSSETPVLDENGRAWLSAMQEDPSAQAHVRGLLSKLVAEFVKVDYMEISTISEVVILGPVLCREDYRTLLSCFIQRFDQTPLLSIDMLRGMVQLLQTASPGYLEDDDLVRILASLRIRLESTHAPSRAHVYQLVVAVSKVLEVMVTGEVKGLNRQRDHESLLAVLRGLRGVKDDEFLKFQVDYAHQTLLYLPDDETSWQTFLRHAESVAVGVSAAACDFEQDPMSSFTATEHLQNDAGNAIDVIHINIGGAHTLQATVEGAAEAEGSVSWPKSKEAWFLTLQAAYDFIRQGRLVDFNKLVCNAGCRFDINFQRGVCQILGEIAANQLWDITSRRNAIDFLGGLYRDEARRNKNMTIQKCVVSILSRVSRMSRPVVSEHSRSLLANLQEDELADTETEYPLHIFLPQPTRSPLLDRVLKIPEVEYDIDYLKFHRLQERPLPVFIPPRAKATLETSDSDFFPLMQKVQEFLESDRQVFLLLGESGSGKSLFCRQLERVLWGQYEVSRRIPLFINLLSIDRPDYDLIGKHLRDHNNILAHRVQEIKQHRLLVLICDGYDECGVTTNLHTTNNLNQPGQCNVKMVVSCRTTFFGRDYQGRFHPYGADRYHDSPSNLFEEATIVPFTEDDVEAYIQQHTRMNQDFSNDRPRSTVEWFMNTFRAIPNLSDLVKNPFVLWLALNVLPSLSSDALSKAKIGATRAWLYDRFLEDWICVNKSRIQNTKLKREDYDVFTDLCESEAGFTGCVIAFLIDLSIAMFEHQDLSPVVNYEHREEDTWKGEFFGRKAKSELLRVASPLKRAGAQFRFIDDSFLAYFRSRAFFNPDQGEDDDSYDSGDDDSDDSQNDDSDNSEGDESDGGDECDDDREIDDEGEGSGNNGSSSRNGGSFGGNEETSGGSSGSTIKNDGSSGGGDDWSGGNGDATNGGQGPNDNISGSSGGSGGSGGDDNSSGDRDGSKEDKNNPRQGKDGSRSKKKGRSTKPRPYTPSNLFSRLNVFKDSQVLEFLVDRVHTNPCFEKRLLSYIEQSKSSVGPSLAAANAITILFMSGMRFQDFNLDNVRVPNDYMLRGDLEQVEHSLNGVSLVTALMALAPPDTTQKATSAFTAATFSYKTSTSRPDIPRQTDQHFSATFHQELARQNTDVIQMTLASPAEKDEVQKLAGLFEDYFKALENGQTKHSDLIQAEFQQCFSVLQSALDRNHDLQQHLNNMQQRMLQMQQQALDELAVIQERNQAILTQTYELDHARKPVSTIGDNIDNGPAKFTHLAFEGGLGQVKSTHDVQVYDSGESLG